MNIEMKASLIMVIKKSLLGLFQDNFTVLTVIGLTGAKFLINPDFSLGFYALIYA
jgi:hypothetical protein